MKRKFTMFRSQLFVVLAILYGSISIIVIIGNGLVILVIANNKRMQTVTNIFIGNLAIVDVVIGLFTTPFQFQPARLQRLDFPVPFETLPHQVVKMLIIVVLLFVFCWMPFQLYGIISEFQPEINGYKYINVICICCNWLAMSTCYYNPFIYGLLNEKFKREYRLLLLKLYCVRKCASSESWLAGNENSDEPNETKRITLTFRAVPSFRQGSASSKTRNSNGKIANTAVPANCQGCCEDTDQTTC